MIDVSAVKGRYMLADPTGWLRSPCQSAVDGMYGPVPGVDQDQKVSIADSSPCLGLSWMFSLPGVLDLPRLALWLKPLLFYMGKLEKIS